MMKKQILAVLLVVLVLAMAGCGRKKAEETTEATVIETTAATTEATVPETTIPGLEDSIFDDEPEETTEATKATEETKPQNQNGGSSNKPTEPKPTEPKPTQPKPTEPKPTQPKPTEPEPNDPEPETPKPNDPKPTEPKPTEPKPTEPKPTEPKPTEPKPTEGNAATEYEWFQNLSPSAQQEHMESFSSIDAFFEWYNAAREAYDEANPPIEVGSGTIDIGAIIEGKN